MGRYGEHGRASVYLVLRAEALIGALRFFVSDTDAKLRRLQFVAQLDYWEWEIDNLIYSFTNFAERQAAWSSPVEANRKLLDAGVVVDAKLMRRLSYGNGQWRTDRGARRVAPVDMLREAINLWNKALDAAQSSIIDRSSAEAARWNIQTESDLVKHRKSMPDEFDAADS